MKRFDGPLAALPAGCIFDGEIITPDRIGRPIFADLMMRRGARAYVAFDVLMAEGADLRLLPLAHRKAILKRLANRARHWIAVTDGVNGEGRRLFELVGAMDLEGIVAKRLGDPYAPGSTTWWKILNRAYSRKEGRSELFERGDPPQTSASGGFSRTACTLAREEISATKLLRHHAMSMCQNGGEKS